MVFKNILVCFSGLSCTVSHRFMVNDQFPINYQDCMGVGSQQLIKMSVLLLENGMTDDTEISGSRRVGVSWRILINGRVPKPGFYLVFFLDYTILNISQ